MIADYLSKRSLTSLLYFFRAANYGLGWHSCVYSSSIEAKQCWPRYRFKPNNFTSPTYGAVTTPAMENADTRCVISSELEITRIGII